jgi:glycosyltransferase involved in cell wall biosynthesis
VASDFADQQEKQRGGEPPRLTVVIPHYNHIDMLPRALASVLDQDFEGIEIVVVDDGSQASCQPILDALEAAVPTMRLIRHSVNKGAPAALNSGIGAARGKMISFLGADDLVLQGLYAAMAAALERSPQAALACGEIAIAGDDRSIRGIRPITVPALGGGYLSPELVKKRLRTTDNWICNTATVYQTALLRRIGGFEESLGSFCDGFASRVLAFENGFVFVPGIFGVWRVASDTLSASSVLDPENATAFVSIVLNRLAASPITGAIPDYPETYARRLRFGAARLRFVWGNINVDPADVVAIAGLGPGDLHLLSAIKRMVGFRWLGSRLALGWLMIRLRPFGFAQLVLHMLRNRYLSFVNQTRITSGISRAEALGQELLQSKDSPH